jgi:hypothetical protein
LLPLPLEILIEPDSCKEKPGDTFILPLTPSTDDPVVIDKAPLRIEPDPVDTVAFPEIRTASPDPK